MSNQLQNMKIQREKIQNANLWILKIKLLYYELNAYAPDKEDYYLYQETHAPHLISI